MVAGCVTETHGVPRHTHFGCENCRICGIFGAPFWNNGIPTGWEPGHGYCLCVYIFRIDNPLLGRMTVGVTNEAWCSVVAR